MLQEDRPGMLRVRMPPEALLSPCQPPVQELHHFQRHPGTDVPDEPALECPLQQLGEVREHFGRYSESKVVAPHRHDVPLTAVHEDHGKHRDRLGAIVLHHVLDVISPESTRSLRPIHALS